MQGTYAGILCCVFELIVESTLVPRHTYVHTSLSIYFSKTLVGNRVIQALREEGYSVVLLNSNPATIMTDPETADRTYICPMVKDSIEDIIKREKPQAILPTMGGQTALNLAIELSKSGILEKYDVELIGAKLEAIEKVQASSVALFFLLFWSEGEGGKRNSLMISRPKARSITKPPPNWLI